jgi:hypothetical protein
VEKCDLPPVSSTSCIDGYSRQNPFIMTTRLVILQAGRERKAAWFRSWVRSSVHTGRPGSGVSARNQRQEDAPHGHPHLHGAHVPGCTEGPHRAARVSRHPPHTTCRQWPGCRPKACNATSGHHRWPAGRAMKSTRFEAPPLPTPPLLWLPTMVVWLYQLVREQGERRFALALPLIGPSLLFCFPYTGCMSRYTL